MKKTKVFFGMPILVVGLALFMGVSHLGAAEAPIRGDDLFSDDPVNTLSAPIRGDDLFSDDSVAAVAPIRGDDLFGGNPSIAKAPIRGDDLF